MQKLAVPGFVVPLEEDVPAEAHLMRFSLLKDRANFRVMN